MCSLESSKAAAEEAFCPDAEGYYSYQCQGLSEAEQLLDWLERQGVQGPLVELDQGSFRVRWRLHSGHSTPPTPHSKVPNARTQQS